MPLIINQPNQATDTERVAGNLYKQQMQRISDKAEQIRRERTTNQQEPTMPLRTRAESEVLPEPDDHQRIVDLEKIVVDMAVQIERLDQRLKQLEPNDPMIRPRRSDDDDDDPTEVENRIRRQVSGRAA
ncbi:hypothetical protein CKO42_20980 [Lamprobacter modestohalophilus]|uniref:Uncharacterized protein n=1 Tax=Lamprobacter modestohalophilus TaxID=1064514 RepID=A0A9X0WCW6_9GAMM|nr:hypothetical protein [Lamprobacter modestohalophilus]MBK1620855.1 hypothetical protein [Lamprobacter modestohalophilus]